VLGAFGLLGFRSFMFLLSLITALIFGSLVYGGVVLVKKASLLKKIAGSFLFLLAAVVAVPLGLSLFFAIFGPLTWGAP